MKKKKLELKEKKVIHVHNHIISAVGIFPSGNLVSVSFDCSIIIYNSNFEILQTIPFAHGSLIQDLSIKDENNFITCSNGKGIKTWIKIKDEFVLNEFIPSSHSHNDIINKILYLNKGKIISCSKDKTIKIWEEKVENKHQCVTILTHLNSVNSFLLLEDKNLLISSGEEETKFWNLKNNNYKCIKTLTKYWANYKNSLKRIDNDKIIINNNKDGKLYIISIDIKEIIFIIDIEIECFGIEIINNKNIILIGGDENIIVFKCDNYEQIQFIENAHNGEINGFIQINNEDILSFSNDETMKIWSF